MWSWVRVPRWEFLFVFSASLLVATGSTASGNEFAPVAQLAARRSHNPKVASSILAGSIAFLFFLFNIFFIAGRHQSRVGFCPGGTAFGWMAERSKALV